MHVERIGFASLKGTRHLERTDVDLAVAGPVGDRELCLVDLERERVLRTVENPRLVGVVASRSGDDLRLDLPGGVVEAPVVTGGDPLKVDYWGRLAELELVDGPFSEALSDHLGHSVRLARLLHPGDIVYGGSVSLVGTGAIAALADRVGHGIDSARFRSTLLVDTDDLAPHVEDDWIGSEVSVGEAVLLVTAVVARCAVIDIDPVSGARDRPVLATLAGYRRAAREIVFGVDAEVVRPGRVRTGDPVIWEGELTMPFLLRVELPDVPGSLGRVATAIGEAGGDIEAIEIVEHRRDGTAVDDVLLETAPGIMPDSIVSACNQLDGVHVLWISRYAAGGNLFLDLEAVEQLTLSARTACDELVDLLPITFRADWAMRLRVGADGPVVLHRTSAAPDSLGHAPGWFPRAHAARLDLPEEWRHLESTLLAGAPLTDSGEIILFGRRGGPDVLDSELARLQHLAALAVSITKTG